LESEQESNNSSKGNSFLNFFKKICKAEDVEIYSHDKEPTIEDYIERRYKPQLQYYEKHSTDNRVRFYISQIVIIIVSALIPIINIIPTDNNENINAIKMASSIFGFIIIVATGFLQLTKSQENWISYRSTAELLKTEYNLFKMKTGDYSDEKIGNDNRKREQLIVNRIETIISEEGKKFLSSHEKFEVDIKPKEDK